MYFLDSKLSYVSYIYPLVFSRRGGELGKIPNMEFYTLFVRNVLILEVLKCKRKKEKKKEKTISSKTGYFITKCKLLYWGFFLCLEIVSYRKQGYFRV